MPSAFAEPTVAELVEAFGDGIRAQRDRYVDAREGAIYQHWGGVAAILWSRNAQRDTDLWRAIYIDSAEGRDLTNLLESRYGFERTEDDYGVGKASLRRSSVVAGGGTIWRGTRICVFGPTVTPKFYVVQQDAPVLSTATTATVLVRAATTGPGTAINVGAGAARVEDPLWDTTWNVESLTCGDGTAFESAPAARARFRDARRAARPGFPEAIVQACKDNGAANAVIFPSNYAGDDEDNGLNMAYVGDAGFTGTDRLVRKVAIALESWRVLGDQLQVRPLTRSNVVFKASVHLWDSPTRVNQDDVRKRIAKSVFTYFDSQTTGFGYDLDALAGVMMKASPEVQIAAVDTPFANADVVSMVGGRLNFPSTLPRYFLSPNDITIELLPPL